MGQSDRLDFRPGPAGPGENGLEQAFRIHSVRGKMLLPDLSAASADSGCGCIPCGRTVSQRHGAGVVNLDGKPGFDSVRLFAVETHLCCGSQPESARIVRANRYKTTAWEPVLYLRTRIHNHSIPSERVFCRPGALKNLAIHKVLSAFFRLAGQQNPSPIRHPLIMNTGS